MNTRFADLVYFVICKNSRDVPPVWEPLTIQTLRPSRIITAVLSQLEIKCDNVERGCPDIVKLENLEAHVVNCAFSPVKCSNEGCALIINRKDQADHESNECFFS